jgi:hypothetical protein
VYGGRFGRFISAARVGILHAWHHQSSRSWAANLHTWRNTRTSLGLTLPVFIQSKALTLSTVPDLVLTWVQAALSGRLETPGHKFFSSQNWIAIWSTCFTLQPFVRYLGWVW